MPEDGPGAPAPLLPVWLLSCYFCIVVAGGVIANAALVVTAVKERRRRHQVAVAAVAGGAHSVQWDSWWLLVGQLALSDALALALVSGGELWALRETGGPWRLPRSLCSPFMGLEAALGAAQTYLLVAIALHARACPTDPVPAVSVWRGGSRSAVVPSALVWLLASGVAVPRTFLAVAVSPRPALPLCTLLPTSPSTGALEGPLDGPLTGPWAPWVWAAGGPVLYAVVLCAAPALLLVATTLPSLFACPRARSSAHRALAPCPPHKLIRREWVRVSVWLSLGWLCLSLPRLLSAAVHGLLPPPASPNPSAFRVPPLGSRALPDSSLLAVSMLHYSMVAARPLLAAFSSQSTRRAVLSAVLGLARRHWDEQTQPQDV